MRIVVKLGGSIFERAASKPFIEDVKTIYDQGHRLVLIHGGGRIVSEVSKRMGKEPRFVVSPKGFRSRYTDEEDIQIYSMVMAGKVNKSLVSAFLSGGLPAVGLSGLDGATVKARRKRELLIVDENGRRRIIDGDYSGKIEEVDPSLINLLLGEGYLPIVSPMALGEHYEPLNVDGDRLAAHVAGALKADALVIFTDVEGVILDGRTIGKLTYMEAEEVLPRIGHGMTTKVYAALEALDMGVKEVRISSGLRDKPLTEALTGDAGTLITHA
ncbi:[LysW]-aminoadipate/[LysW]-glutamate kinase [Candidatus Bathyarchaeota archaeon]|nr:[LysW]-aminoadipate/[LysW]-glutamate kinase [Candidatus Bathyarchaeota archaeon]